MKKAKLTIETNDPAIFKQAGENMNSESLRKLGVNEVELRGVNSRSQEIILRRTVEELESLEYDA